nr:hypothetical protein CFP56_75130 [Quercus suber]
MFEFALLVVPSWRNHILRILKLLVDWWDNFISPQDLNFGAQECYYQAAKEEFQFPTKFIKIVVGRPFLSSTFVKAIPGHITTICVALVTIFLLCSTGVTIDQFYCTPKEVTNLLNRGW